MKAAHQDMTWSEKQQFVASMATDAFRVAMLMEPRRHTRDEVIAWIQAASRTALKDSANG